MAVNHRLCPRIELHQEKLTSDRDGVPGVVFYAYPSEHRPGLSTFMPVGVIELFCWKPRGRGYAGMRPRSAPRAGCHLAVVSVSSDFRRRGCATALYEAAARWSCDHFGPLVSDSARSAYSDAFWLKQVRKGRAECLVLGRPPPKALDWATVENRGGCARYGLPCPAPASLAAARRR